MKPWVKVSTCPVGKYSDTARYPSRGWNAFHTVYQDVQGWLGEGIQDQIYPMMYFRGNRFLSLRPRLAGTKQRTADYSRSGHLLPRPRRRQLDGGRGGTADKLHPCTRPGGRRPLPREVSDGQYARAL